MADAGYFVDPDDPSVEKPCPAGTSSGSGSTGCTPCAEGTYSGEGDSTCTSCGQNEVSASGSTECDPCPDRVLCPDGHPDLGGRRPSGLRPDLGRDASPLGLLLGRIKFLRHQCLRLQARHQRAKTPTHSRQAWFQARERSLIKDPRFERLAAQFRFRWRAGTRWAVRSCRAPAGIDVACEPARATPKSTERSGVTPPRLGTSPPPRVPNS